MMKPCIGCEQLTVNVEEPPRYDVMNPEYDPNTTSPDEMGPYCAECWMTTYTGALEAQKKNSEEEL